MGDEAVVMATATGITSRWNNGSPNRGSVETEDFGVVGAIVQAISRFLIGSCQGYYSPFTVRKCSLTVEITPLIENFAILT